MGRWSRTRVFRPAARNLRQWPLPQQTHGGTVTVGLGRAVRFIDALAGLYRLAARYFAREIGRRPRFYPSSAAAVFNSSPERSTAIWPGRDGPSRDPIRASDKGSPSAHRADSQMAGSDPTRCWPNLRSRCWGGDLKGRTISNSGDTQDITPLFERMAVPKRLKRAR